MSKCVITDSIFNNGIHDITYIAPEKSLNYSPENDNCILILKEKRITIKSVFPEAEIYCRKSFKSLGDSFIA